MEHHERFEADRAHLKAVAYRMLGSLSEADDAVQETWLRFSRSDVGDVENLSGWLTTVTGRICLDMLRTRKSRREESLEVQVPDPIVGPVAGFDPEHEVMVADSVGLALLVVLETLSPAERLAFVLHDMFAVPFEEIAAIADRSPASVRQLASRARRRVQDSAPSPETDPARQREVVDAFFAASRSGDFEALLAVLDPDVVLRADTGAGAVSLVRGARAVASQAASFQRIAPAAQMVVVNGTIGMMTAPGGKPVAIGELTVRNGRIIEINILADLDRLEHLPVN